MCATLYELVSGRVPFHADNYNAAMFAVLHQQHAPLVEVPEEDRQIAAIIDRGLSKNREERFQSADELARHLSSFLSSRGVLVDACGHLLHPPMAAAGRARSTRLSPWRSLTSRRFDIIAGAAACSFGLYAWGWAAFEERAQAMPQQAEVQASLRVQDERVDTTAPIRLAAPPGELKVASQGTSGAAKSPRSLTAAPTARSNDVARASAPDAGAAPHPEQRKRPTRDASSLEQPTAADRAPRANSLGYDFGL
jgi:hypothetical protein